MLFKLLCFGFMMIPISALRSDRCLCSTFEPGVYNGITLNRFRTLFFCLPNVYFCSGNKKEPELLIDCYKHPGCFYQPELIDCKCSKKQVKNHVKVCGDELSGRMCKKQLAYHCVKHYPELLGPCDLVDIKEDLPKSNKTKWFRENLFKFKSFKTIK